MSRLYNGENNMKSSVFALAILFGTFGAAFAEEQTAEPSDVVVQEAALEEVQGAPAEEKAE